MDWDFAVRRQREALLGVLAALLAMAGLAGSGAEFPSPLWGGVRGGGENPSATPTRPSDDGGPPHKGEVRPEFRPTLPRHLHRAVLRLLRPAEAAARRLVIAAARGLVVTLPRSRKSKPAPPVASRPAPHGEIVTGIWMPPHLRPQAARLPSASRRARPLRALPLFDPLPRLRGTRRSPSGVPRLCTPGWSAPHPLPPERPSKGRGPLSPDDEIDALRLAQRLGAVLRALDDLDGHARRFARWRAARDAAGAQNENRDAAGAQNENRDAPQTGSGVAGMAEARRSSPSRARRVWPLKPGRPPGLVSRLSGSRRADHAVHDILRDAHALALEALERSDTS